MVLAVDIGTSFLKVGLVDFSGNILFLEKKKLDSILDSNTWVSSLTDLCLLVPQGLIERAEAVVISGNGPTMVPVGFDGKPNNNALLWNDTRSQVFLNEINDKLGEKIPPNFYLNKAYWFMNEYPEIYKNTSSFLSCPEYLCYVLTGSIYTLLPSPGFSRLYWDEKKVKKLNMDISKFPDFLSPFKVFGKFSGKDVIPRLRSGIPVICGGPDFVMSILGSGSVINGIICDRTGTSEGLNYCSSKELTFNNMRTLPHILPNLYTIAGLIPNSGELVLNNNLNEIVDKYKEIIGFYIKSGLYIKEVRIIGGHANIEELNIMKSQLFPFPLKVYPIGSELIGNGILGATVLKKYKTIEEGCRAMVREKSCYNV